MLRRRIPSPAPSCNEDAFIIRTAVDDPVAHLPHESFSDVALPGCARRFRQFRTFSLDLSFHADRNRCLLFPPAGAIPLKTLESVVAVIAGIAVVYHRKLPEVC